MQNDMDNYLRYLARSCAKEAFEKAREKGIEVGLHGNQLREGGQDSSEQQERCG